MDSKSWRRTGWLVVALALAATAAQAQGRQRTLADNDNPELIGKRDINKHQLDFYSLDKEIALGRQLAAEVDRQSKLVTDPLITEYVNRVGQNLVLHSDAKVPFTIKVIDSNEINAFALPGGFLYVNRAVLETADNEAELAGVMAHEIGHVAARHGVEQASKANLINYGSVPLIFLGGWGGLAIRQAAGLAVPITFLKFSREMESEADRLGAQYLWAAGYDPNAMISFFEKLQAQEKKKPGTMAKVFSTHPMTGDRITAIRALVARFPDRQEYALTSSEFKDVKARLVAVNSAQHPGGARGDRPTLRRRGASTSDAGRSGDGDPDQAPDERPTLKRGGSNADGDDSNPPQDPESRPTLKRRNDTNKGP
jgi:predicted Zn-dependent protease